MAGGITFGAAKSRLRTSVDGGIGATNSRVMERTNEIQELILSRITPVNGMMDANVTTDALGFFLLPPEMENAIDVLVLGAVDNEVSQQYFYEITNQFTYLDPSMAKDSPLIDHGLAPDPGPPPNPTVLRRRYEYPGLNGITQLHVTGDKSFVPITSDDDYLTVQNIPALQIGLEAITLRMANAAEEVWMGRLNSCIQVLQEEVTRHMMDRRNFMRRRAAYEADLITFPMFTKGWMRAIIALEQPGAMLMGKSELDRLLDRAQMEMIEMGTYKGTLQEFTATVFGGEVSMPTQVESMLATDLCGLPVDLRSTFFSYLENGPGGWDCSCGGYIRDLGEEYLGDQFRRTYQVLGSITQGQTLKAICKLRWLPQIPTDMLLIKNLRANRAMMAALIKEQDGDDDGAAKKRARVKEILEMELREYLSGLHYTQPISADGWDLADIGSPL